MKEVRFIAVGSDMNQANEFTCEFISEIYLNEKEYVKFKNIDVRCLSAEDAIDLDNLMWSYPKNIFLPHELINTSCGNNFINIGYPGVKFNSQKEKLLVNLNPDLPKDFSNYTYIYQFIIEDSGYLRDGAAKTWKKCKEIGLIPIFEKNK